MNEVPDTLKLSPGELCALTTEAGLRRIFYRIRPEEDGAPLEYVLKHDLHLSEVSIKRAKAIGKNTPAFNQYGYEQFYDTDNDAYRAAVASEADAPLAGIALDGIRARTNVRVKAGQIAAVIIDDIHLGIYGPAIEPKAGPVDVVFENDDLAIMNKEPGIVMYPGASWRNQETLSNRMAAHFADEGEACNVHPVHRLDKETSGLVVFAKNSYAHSRLQAQLHTGGFSRRYLALCTGWLENESGTIDAPIARLGYCPSVFGIHPEGKRAVTHYKVLERFHTGGVELTAVEFELETGRSHQIRIHLQSIGHPLVGDEAYGGASPLIDRAALHSWRLAVDDPVTSAPIRLEAKLPADMARLLPRRLVFT